MAQLCPSYTGLYPNYDSLLQWSANQQLANEMLLPPLVGWSVNLILTGVILLLFAHYLTSHVYHSDVSLFKIFTWLIVVVDLLLAALSFDAILWYGRTQNRDTITLLVTRELDAMVPVITGLLGTLVQSYLAHRAARLLKVKHKRVALAFLALIIPCTLLSFLASLGTTILFWFGTRNQFHPAGPLLTYTRLQGMWLWFSAGIDCIITTGLFAALRSSNSSPETESTIRFYLILAAETNLYTSVTAVCGASMSVAWPTTKFATVNLPYIFTCPIPSLYTLSFLVNLFARKGEAAGLTKYAAGHVSQLVTQGRTHEQLSNRKPITAATIFLPSRTRNKDSYKSGLAERISVSRSQIVSIDQSSDQ